MTRFTRAFSPSLKLIALLACILGIERGGGVHGAASWVVKPPPGTAINASSSLASGLVGLWHFNQSAFPTNIVNAALSGAYQGTPPLRPTQDGVGVTSDADPNYLSVIDPANVLNFTSGPFSIEVDFYYGSPAPGMVILGRDYFMQDGYNIQTANDGVGKRIVIEVNHGGTFDVYQTGPVLTLGAINRVLITYSGSTASVYINGVSGWENGASGAYSPAQLGLHDLFVGRDASFTGLSFKNPITRLAIWNRELSTGEALTVNSSDPYAYMAAPTVTQPSIVTMNSGSVTANAATVTWTTNIPANSQVQYGVTTGYGLLSTLNGTFLTSHSVSLAALTPGTVYHYQVVSTDATGAMAASADGTFTTLPAPTVTAVTPLNGATTVGQLSTVTATFSGAMTAASINATTFLLQTGVTAVPAAVTYNAATRTATLTPTTQLLGATSYTAKVKGGVGGVTDTAGNPMTADATWIFTTVPDATLPTVTAVSPVAGATAVATTTVSATFSEPMTAASVSAATVLLTAPGAIPVPATVSYNAATLTATLTPTAVLSNLTTYTATIKGGAAGVKDLAANALASDVVWTFTTGGLTIDAVAFGDRSTKSTSAVTSAFSTAVANELLLAFVATDGPASAPNVTVTGVAGAGLTWQLVLRTNVQMGTAEIWRAFATTALSNVTVTATLSQSRPSSITVVSVRNANTSGTSGSGAIGAIQTANANPGAPTATLTTTRNDTWVFGVGQDWDAGTARTLGPNQTMVHQYLPAGIGTFWVQRTNATTPVGGTSVTINDTAPAGDRYNLSLVEILPAGTDTTPPTVTAVTPASGSITNNVAQTVTATFSKPMAPASISATTVLLTGPGATAVPATVAYNAATSTATLTPTAALATNTLYTATVKSGAAGVKDSASNTLTADVTWTFTVDTTPPTVTSATPIPASTISNTATTVTATFSEAMAPATIGATTVLLAGPGTTAVAGAVSFNAATRVATLTPTAALTNGTTYTATVKSGVAGVTDLAGNTLATDVTWTFTVDTASPTVTTVTPLNGTTINTAVPSVTATFSKPMAAATISGTTVLLTGPGATPVAATVTYNPATTTATLTPTAALTTNTLYTATVKSGAAGVKDLAGNSLAADVTWTFTEDRTAPTVTVTTPANGATISNPATTVTATFSEAMAPATIGGTTVLLTGPGATPVAAAVSFNAATRVATLTPTAALTNATTYTATVKGGVAGVTDLAGNPLAADVTWTFTIDTTAPTVTTVAPLNAAIINTAVPSVTATFSKAMTASTINGTTVLLTGPGATPVAATVTYNPATTTATLTPTAALTTNTVYTATVKSGAAGVKDLAGNSLTADMTWTFTEDRTAPTVTAVTPVNGATTGNVTQPVTVTFNEAVTGVSGTTVFLTGPGATPVAATVSYVAATRIATLTPTAAVPGGLYTLTVKSGAAGVVDVAGNPLASDVTSSFTVDTTPPTVTAVTPLDGATTTGVPTVTVTFSEAVTGVSGTTVLLTGPGATAVPATVTYAAATRVATLTPTAALTTGTLYTATVKGAAGGVTDLAGNPLAADVTWTFTVDTTAPTVTAMTPLNAAIINTAVPSVTATFSKAMAAATISGTTVLLTGPGATPVAATVTYNPATTTATLTPTASLTTNTVYTATVKSGAAGVKDLAGNSLTADVIWTFTEDRTAPTVTVVTPANGTTTSNPATTVTATFNEAVAGVSNTTVLLTGPGATPVPATVAYAAATRVATLTPTAALTTGTLYTATVKGLAGGVTDLAGNPLAADVTWTFTVDTAVPTVTAFSPLNAAIINTAVPSVTATFSKAMTASTINGTTVLLTGPGATPVAATVTYNPATTTATLTPTAALTTNTVYTATVKSGAAGVKDSGGIGLTADVTWTFTEDRTAPTVTAVTPANAATTNNLTPTVTVTFSEAVTGVSGTTVLLTGPGATPVAATVIYTAATRVATLTPAAAVPVGLYTVTVKSGAAGVVDAAGNPLASDVTSSFTVDTTAPTVTAFSPLAGATGVAVNTAVTATFNEAMAAATISGATVTLTGPGVTPVAATVAYAAATRIVTLTPTAALTAGTLYTATVKGGAAGVADLAGNPLAADVTWTFTTGACPCSFWTTTTAAGPTDTDTQSIEVGMKFTSDLSGTVTGVRFYKATQNTGTHTGSLWSATGTRLGTVTFTGETASGWQTATFATPIPITANTTYIISYHANVGRYSATVNGFTSALDRAPLHAPSTATAGGNGVYRYGASAFPNLTWNASNYWVDVIFNP